MSEVEPQPVRFSIYPRSVKGRFRNYKTYIMVLAYAVYYGLPWMPWTREIGPDQAVLFDIIGRKYYLFGIVVQPEQIFWLAGLLMIAALLLFFVTGVAGRVFCGYFCFQTLWSDVFYRIEHWIQGERPARVRLDKQTWNGEKIRKKTFTWLLWLLVAFWTAVTFSLYWGNAGDLLIRFFTGDAPGAMYSTTAILTFTTFTMAGLAREQVCTHMCPYSRFQSVMQDKSTRLVSYDFKRGEAKKGRSKVAKGLKTTEDRQAAGLGDCVDCGYCVQVCPTGIDIRDGLQISCIQCALCIDACDNIMERMGWNKGLIRYSSDIEDAGGKISHFGLKNIGYGLALILSSAALIYSISSKASLETAVRQIRQPLYVKLSSGHIQNSYEIKLSNQTSQQQVWKLGLRGLDDAKLNIGQLSSITVQPLKFIVVYAKVHHAPRHEDDKVQDFLFTVDPVGNTQDLSAFEISARFYAP